MRIGIVAGETSGDLLAAGLIQALKKRYPDAQFEGIAGPQMIAAGCKAIFPMERLSVMGFVEVLGRFRELLGIRRRLRDHFLANPPDVFIGVDAPDFNLGLEQSLKAGGIKTVHYVSPSVWAWRQHRVKKIAAAVDLMLALFPFEANFYRQHQIAVKFVGHPLADMIPLEPDRIAARNVLNLPQDKTIVALLPGSRMSEVGALGEVLVQSAQWLQQRRPELVFVAPLATANTRRLFDQYAEPATRTGLDLRVVEGRSRDVMAAADVVIVASGTATLEAMLLKRPMVVTYRQAALTYFLAKRMLKVPYVSLPNLLAGKAVVPELLQDQATAANIGQQALRFLEDSSSTAEIMGTFTDIHQQLRKNASEQAAGAVIELLDQMQ